MMYGLDYICLNVSEFIFQFVSLLYIYLLFTAGGSETIVGMTMYDFYLVYIISELIMTLSAVSVYPNAVRLRNMIFMGQLDLFLVRPKSNFLIHNQRSWVAGLILRLSFFLVTLIYIYHKVSFEWTLENIGLVLFVVISSYLILYFLYWNSAYMYFYFPKFDAYYNFVRIADRMGQKPAKLFPRSMQWIFTFAVPVFLVAGPIYKIIDGTFDLRFLMIIIGVLLVQLLINVLMWRNGIPRYESAS